MMKEEYRPRATSPHLALPFDTAFLYTELGKGTAKCRHCGTPIRKGQRRVVWAVRLPYLRTFPNGGRTRYERGLYHPECVYMVLFGENHPGPRPPALCATCGRHMVEGVPFQLVRSGRQYLPQPMCGLCTMSGQFQLCGRCHTYVPTARLSRVVQSEDDELHPGSVSVCDECAERAWVTTVRDVKRQERDERQFERDVKQAREWVEKMMDGDGDPS